MLISKLPNGNLQVNIILLRLVSEIGLLASLSHTLAKLDNFLHNCCLFGKYLNYFLESGWRSGRVCSVFYSIYYCIRRLCPTSHWGLAKNYWCERRMIPNTKETLLEMVRGSTMYRPLHMLHIHIHIWKIWTLMVFKISQIYSNCSYFDFHKGFIIGLLVFLVTWLWGHPALGPQDYSQRWQKKAAKNLWRC